MRTEYICELCDENFGNDFDGCLKHENEDHIKPKVYAEIEPEYFTSNSFYPDRIAVKMQDGAIVSYVYQFIAQAPDKEESPCANTDSQGNY